MEEYERAFYRGRGVRSLSVLPDLSRSFRIAHASNPILERSLSMAREIVGEPVTRSLENYYMNVQRDYNPRKYVQINVVDAYVPHDTIFRVGTTRYTTGIRSDLLLPPSKLRPIVVQTSTAASLPPFYAQGRKYWRSNDPLQLKCWRSDPYTPNRGPYRALTSHPWRLEYPFRSYSTQYRPTYIHNKRVRNLYMYPQYY